MDDLFKKECERQFQLEDQLQEAVRNNDTAAAERILQQRLTLQHNWINIDSILCCETALKNRCLPMVKLLLSQDFVSNYFKKTFGSIFGVELMIAAVESDFIEGVEFLQSKGCLLNKGCIYKCLENNKPGVLKYILEHQILLLSEPTVYSTPTNNKQLKHVETHALHRCIRGTIFHREPDKVLDCVKILVEAEAGLNLEDKDGKTPIQLAAERGMVTTVIYLVQRGASLNIKQHPTNLLHRLVWGIANVESGSFDECLQLLMTQGVDINQLDSSDQTPLSIAVIKDNVGMVKSLINANCDVNMKVGYDFQHILSTTIIRRDETTTCIPEILIKAGCDTNIPDVHGVTPLMISLKIGEVGLTKLLIDNGASVNAQDNEGKCVLEYTFETFYHRNLPFVPQEFSLIPQLSSSNITQMLIDAGADIPKRNCSILKKVVTYRDKRTALLLLENGIDINTEDEYGDTPLGFAVRNYDIELVKLLISKGGDINHQNLKGETALHKSTLDGPSAGVDVLSVTEILLKAGADVNMCDNYGRTALVEAARGCHRSVLQCLLEAGADVNKTDNYGSTTFMAAAQACYRSGLQWLLEAGADVNKTDRDGHSAIHHVMNNSMYVAPQKWINCLKLLLINKCHESLDTPGKNGQTLFEWLLYKSEADLLWYLVTENCSLEGFRLYRFKDKFEFPDTLMLSKILFESGAPKREIEALMRTSSLDNNQSQMHEFRGFCKSRSLQSRCRREIRNCIGSGIRSKITQLRLPQLLQDYIIMKDLIPGKYFTLVINDKDDDGDSF